MRPRALAALLFVVFVGAGSAALGFPSRARIYPFWVASVGSLLAFLVALKRAANEAPTGPELKDVGPYLVWVMGFLASAAVIGFPVAGSTFVGLFLWREGKVPGLRAVAAAIATGAGLSLIGAALGLRWPRALFDVAAALGIT